MTARWIFAAAMLAAPGAAPSAQPARSVAIVSGTVRDAATGEPLEGAAVISAGRGVVTNAHGFYSLSLPPGPAQIAFSYVGRDRRVVDMRVSDHMRLDVALDAIAELEEVVVDGRPGSIARPERTLQMGHVALAGADIERLPSFLGESDVLKAVQLLPGVRGGQEGTSGLYVRGGSPDQTLVLLDGTPLYNASHLFGFLSTFNADAVSEVELTKGAYPARFGGRLGSVLDVRLRDGDMDRYHLQGQVSVIATRLLAEGPIVPGRASFLVSGRRTHVGLLAGPIVDRANRAAAARGDAQVEPHASFFDLNARINWRPGTRDRLAVNVYAGGDTFGFESIDPDEACDLGGCHATGEEDLYGGGLDWGNLVGSLHYSRVVSPRVLAALTLAASDYDFRVAIDVEEGRNGPAPREARARYRSGIRDFSARADVDVSAGRTHMLRVGAGVTLHRFTPGALSVIGQSATEAPLDTLRGLSESNAVEAAAYVEDALTVGRLSLGVGVRATYYASGRHRYPSVEPRLSAGFLLHERVALKASAAITQQPVHLLTTGAGIGLPADLWMPADSVGPERGWQAAGGLAGSLPGGRTTWTLEAYWREMEGLVTYRDGASFATPFEDWQELVVTGDGRSVGIEALIQHRTDRLTAWIGYTLARSDRRFDALDDGQRFPFRYDRRHDLSIVAVARLSRRIDASALFVFGTGDAVTLPTATFDATYLNARSVDYWIQSNEYAIEETAYGPRNRFRLPSYSRLDVGATFYFRRGPRPHSLSLSVYNATNRKNPFVTTLDSRFDETTGESRRQLIGIALFPVLPSLSYQFAF